MHIYIIIQESNPLHEWSVIHTRAEFRAINTKNIFFKEIVFDSVFFGLLNVCFLQKHRIYIGS